MMQPRPSSAAHSVAAQRAQTTREPGTPTWRDKYRVPSQITGADSADIDRIRDLVGSTLILSSVDSGSSQTKGRFVRFDYQAIDIDTGELLTPVARCVSFAQAIVRFADHLAGGKLDGVLVLNPPIAVRVDQAGDAIIFTDPL